MSASGICARNSLFTNLFLSNRMCTQSSPVWLISLRLNRLLVSRNVFITTLLSGVITVHSCCDGALHFVDAQHASHPGAIAEELFRLVVCWHEHQLALGIEAHLKARSCCRAEMIPQVARDLELTLGAQGLNPHLMSLRQP